MFKSINVFDFLKYLSIKHYEIFHWTISISIDDINNLFSVMWIYLLLLSFVNIRRKFLTVNWPYRIFSFDSFLELLPDVDGYFS